MVLLCCITHTTGYASVACCSAASNAARSLAAGCSYVDCRSAASDTARWLAAGWSGAACCSAASDAACCSAASDASSTIGSSVPPGADRCLLTVLGSRKFESWHVDCANNAVLWCRHLAAHDGCGCAFRTSQKTDRWRMGAALLRARVFATLLVWCVYPLLQNRSTTLTCTCKRQRPFEPRVHAHGFNRKTHLFRIREHRFEMSLKNAKP